MVDEKDLWFNETTKKIELTPGGMQYRYRDRSKVASAYRYKRTQSKESSTEVRTSNNITNIQKWVKYIKTKEIDEKINKKIDETSKNKNQHRGIYFFSEEYWKNRKEVIERSRH